MKLSVKIRNLIKRYPLPSVSGLVRRQITKDYLRIIQKRNVPPQKILDIGSGLKPWSECFSGNYELYHTIEFDENISATYHLDFFDFETAVRYDLVIATEFIEHIPKPREFFKKCHQILQDDGCLLITFPFLFKLHANPDDYFRYSKSAIQHLIDPFFEIEIWHCHGGKWQAAWEILIDGRLFYFLRLLNPLIGSKKNVKTDFPLGFVAILRRRGEAN